ncbi:MLO-like protein 10 [Carex littledalei]|uniref:MLO-like protein n=1 Tax=Carex littledalei TaxID=544730 RepID=A0A833QD45_9POAL|nr:MLO-like protein 10 [Carex littledalei]
MEMVPSESEVPSDASWISSDHTGLRSDCVSVGHIKKAISDDSFVDVDKSSKSLLSFTGNSNVYSLYCFLLNQRIPFPFRDICIFCKCIRNDNDNYFMSFREENAMEEIQVYKDKKRADGPIPLGGDTYGLINLRDSIIPPWVISGISAAMKANGATFTIISKIDPSSEGLNVALDNISHKLDSNATSSSRTEDNTLGIRNTVLVPSLRNGALRSVSFRSDPSRFRFTHETSFVRQHANIWSRSIIVLYIVSFFRQFIRSVRKTDYLTLRHGFINAHLNPGMKFNFHKYIKRSLEDDFKVVVGIRYVILLVIVMILAVGTKLQAIIASMALEIQQRHEVIQGMPLVKLSNHHFWFGRPHLVLFLIHFILFVNAFQLANFLWIWFLFGLRSCFHESFSYVVARICIGVAVHLLCSYITLPLYALVSQMGSHIKMSIFDEQTSKALKKWRDAARKRNKRGSSHSPSVTPSPSPGQSPMASPASRHLHRYRTMGYAGEGIRRSHSDNEISDVDIEMSITRSELNRKNAPQEMRLNVEERRDEDEGRDRRDEDDFSFVKLGSRREQSK